MRDPIRLTDDVGAATAKERELLRAGKAARLGAQQKEQLWYAIAAQCPPPLLSGPGAPTSAGVPGIAAGAGGSVGAALSAVKGTLLAIVLGSGVLTGLGAWRHHQTPRVAAPAAAAPVGPAREAIVEPTTAPPVSAPSPEPAARATRSPARALRAPTAGGAGVPAEEPPPSRLAAETQVIVRARADLRAGDAAAALRILEEARRAFAGGALVQERESLTIEALADAGQGDAARDRAAAFLRAYPKSPHAANVKRFADQ